MSASADASLRRRRRWSSRSRTASCRSRCRAAIPSSSVLPQLLLIEALADATPRPVATAVRTVAQRTGVSEADLASFVQR
jgi:hypothetical protein